MERPTGEIKQYLDLNKWQVAGIQKAVASLDRDEGFPHEQVKEWVGSWNSKKERLAPTLGDMNILWSPKAIEGLNSLRAYIAQDNPSAAQAVALENTKPDAVINCGQQLTRT